jgi:hypothetical protein
MIVTAMSIIKEKMDEIATHPCNPSLAGKPPSLESPA